MRKGFLIFGDGEGMKDSLSRLHAGCIGFGQERRDVVGKPTTAADTALMMAGTSNGKIRFVNVLPLTPVMLAEYVPHDFGIQQRKAAEDALAIVVKETGLSPDRVVPRLDHVGTGRARARTVTCAPVPATAARR